MPALRARGVLYAPDYAINAGGVISVALGEPGTGDAAIRAKVEAIGDTLTRIFRTADETDQPTQAVADQLAKQRLSTR